MLRRSARDEFDALWIWDDAATREALGWYRAVATNRLPAKFRIAATIPVALDPAEGDEEALWAELERLTPVFLARRDAIRAGEEPLGPPAAGPSLLDLVAALAARGLAHCNFCAWDCGVDRERGTKPGACRLGAETRVSTFFHHLGEELVYRGVRGSGTIFFTSCNMRCAFCQNGDISTDSLNGMPVSTEGLAAMAWLLRMEGCHNINWVGGDPAVHLHRILGAIALLGRPGWEPSPAALAEAVRVKADGFHRGALDPRAASFDRAFNAPMLWNSNMYLSEAAMRLLRIVTDVWLPDFKFGPGRCAIVLARTPRYWETVTHRLATLRDWGEDMTIRHLVMPAHVACCTRPVLDWLAEEMPGVPVNIMDQYRPEMFADPRSPDYRPRYAEIARRPMAEEIAAALEHARARGLAFEPITSERRRRGALVRA